MTPPPTPAPTVPHPLDVPQTFLPGPSHDVRDALGSYISRDLLGPWDGPAEKLPHHSAGPGDRYLVGRLGPRGSDARTREELQRSAAQEADVEPGSDADGHDPAPADQLTPQAAGSMFASSMGLSFVVPAAIGTLTVRASWGRYALSQSAGDEGRPVSVWAREQVDRECDVDVTAPGDHRRVLDGGDSQGPDTPGVKLHVQVRRRQTGSDGEDLRVLEVTLVNALPEARDRRDANWLFQTRLEVTAFPDERAAVFLPIDDPLSPGAGPAPDDPEEQRLRLLYRDSLRHAIGRNVAVHARVRDGERRAHKLETTWLPEYDVPVTTAPTAADQQLLAGLELGMDELAELAVPDRTRELAAALAPLADGYHAWLQEQRSKAQSLPEDLQKVADAAVDEAEKICHRITLGIDHLRVDPDALEAFRFANRAMALQRRNTSIAALRAGHEHDPASYAEARAQVYGENEPDDAARAAVKKQAASWRPFQLAFVLLNVASLAQPGHEHRGTGREAVVDLLFFPTGGGKTEAYLGLAAMTFALRRLQGTLGTGEDARSGAAGVAVLMRYTLRLLTAQQFQRAAALVSAAEMLRREEVAAGDERWGKTPFRIGLWVGTSVSPNWFGEAREQVAAAVDSADDKYARVIQVLSCPWCGQGLTAHRNMEADEGRRRVLLYCPRGEGEDRCPFSRLAAPEEGIPVLTVDEEIYRLAPAMLIATVDKLAQLPWNGYAGLLFGRATEWCPRHGFRHDDLDAETGCGRRHNAKGRLPAVRSQPVPRLRPPDLVIQDELHLISGALGTTVGLFEAAVDQLCTWSVIGAEGTRREVGPKIVASTATTKRAADQVRGVFGRKVAVFPPQVVDVGDTFFSRQVELSGDHPGRRYLGVCAHGTRLKAAEIRVAEIMLLAGQQLFDTYGEAADPYMTLVGYFNATRELAGMRRYLDDDITTRIRQNGSRKGHESIADRLIGPSDMLTIQELTSRISSSDISAALKRLETGFDAEWNTSVRRRARLEEVREAARDKREPRVPSRNKVQSAVDVVLATSMLQVGVDVSRFGLMLVVGQPKNTAEYIQASSRVGRDVRRPGLVVTLYNWSRPRDLAHFEDFEHYHATFYRQVEALSVTPFTRRALDRGTAPAYVAALRQAAYEHSRNTDADGLDLEGPVAAEVERRLLERAETVGGARARGYLSERLEALKDRWAERREIAGALLGYRAEKKDGVQVTGLLNRADGGRWDELTVPMSMRETENEINLLFSAGALVDQPSGSGPAWTFGTPDDSGPAAADAVIDPDADSDELGPSPAGKGQS